MKAYVLAAGLGTRLAPLTQERPKPLVEVLGAPLLHYALGHVVAAGARSVVVNTHWLADAIEAQGARVRGLDVRYSREAGEILGTGGGLKQMAALDPPAPGEPFLLLNADALLDLDVAGLVRAHDAARPVATLVLKKAPDQAKYGVLGTDAAGRVRSFAGRVPYEGPPLHERMFCGVHVATQAVLDELPAGVSDVNKAGYPPLLRRGADVRGFFQDDAYFCDVGTPERLLEANLDLLSGRARFRFTDLFARFGNAAPGRWVHPTARVDGARLIEPVLVDQDAVVEPGAVVGPFAVVGRDATVRAGATLSRAVVQSRAQVPAGAHDGVIVGPSCRIVVDGDVVRAYT